MKLNKLLFIIGIFSIQLLSANFDDSKFKIHLNYDDTKWTQMPHSSFRDRLVLKHISQEVTLNILAYKFSETITVNGLVQKRVQSVYDGWQLINQKEMTDVQLSAANIDDGIISIYRKPILNRNLQEVYQIVGDMCMVVEDSLGVIINTHAATTEDLLAVKEDTGVIYKSFWYGDERPVASNFIENNFDWVMNGQNLQRQRYYKSAINISDKLSILKKIPLSSIKFSDIHSFHNKNGTYISDDDHIVFLNKNYDDPIIHKKEKRNSDIILNSTGMYALINDRNSKVIKYNLDFSVDWEHKADGNIQYIAPVNDHLLYLTNKHITLLNKDQSELWSIKNKNNIGVVSAIKEQLYISNKSSNDIIEVNLTTGEQINRYLHKDLLADSDQHKFNIIDMISLDMHVVVVYQYLDQVIVKLFNQDGFVEEGQLVSKFKEFKLHAVTSKLIVFEYTDEKRTLQAIDLFTFAPAWEVEFSWGTPPIVANSELLYIDDDSNLVSLNLKTGLQSGSINVNNLTKDSVVDGDYEEDKDSMEIEHVHVGEIGLMGVLKSGDKNEIVILR